METGDNNVLNPSGGQPEVVYFFFPSLFPGYIPCLYRIANVQRKSQSDILTFFIFQAPTVTCGNAYSYKMISEFQKWNI